MICSKCGNQTEDSAIFCDDCGERLPEAPPTPVVGEGNHCPKCNRIVANGERYCNSCGAAQTQPPPVQQEYDNSVPANSTPRLILNRNKVTLSFPAGKTVVIVGREDPVSDFFPEVDLDPYGGDEGGVSRNHAKFNLQGTQWYVQDLDSTNFTILNKQKLKPNKPSPINSNDEIRLGKITMTFVIK